jgi:hypothetical protein
MFFESRKMLHGAIVQRQILSINHLRSYVKTQSNEDRRPSTLYGNDFGDMSLEAQALELESKLNRCTVVTGLSRLSGGEDDPVDMFSILGVEPGLEPRRAKPLYMPFSRKAGRGLSLRAVAILTAVDALIRLSVIHFVPDRWKARLYAGFTVQYLINVSYLLFLTGADKDSHWIMLFRFFDDQGNRRRSPNFDDDAIAHLEGAYRPRIAGGAA